VNQRQYIHTTAFDRQNLAFSRLLRVKRFGARSLIYALLVVGSAMYSVPFFWMVTTSLKTMGDILRFPPVWIPIPPRLQNYLAVWDVLPFNRFLANTAVLTGLSTLGALLSCSVVAFGFARLRFRGRDFFFTLLLATMMLPSQVTLIPQFALFRWLGWLNSLKPLIVPAFFGNAFYIFLLRQFFLGLPRELDEAALIDGAGTFDIFWRVILPLAKPALSTVAIFSFIFNWNDFFRPLIYLTTPDKMTLAVGLQLLRGRHGGDYNILMAGSTLAILPVMVVFFFTQKTFVQGIALTGLKG